MKFFQSNIDKAIGIMNKKDAEVKKITDELYDATANWDNACNLYGEDSPEANKAKAKYYRTVTVYENVCCKYWTWLKDRK